MAEYLSISLLRNTIQLFRHYRFNLQYAPVGVAEGGFGEPSALCGKLVSEYAPTEGEGCLHGSSNDGSQCLFSARCYFSACGSRSSSQSTITLRSVRTFWQFRRSSRWFFIFFVVDKGFYQLWQLFSLTINAHMAPYLINNHLVSAFRVCSWNMRRPQNPS